MMFAVLQHLNIPYKITWLWREPEPFAITVGMLQGDVLAPFLFITVINNASKISAGDFASTQIMNNQNFISLK